MVMEHPWKIQIAASTMKAKQEFVFSLLSMLLWIFGLNFTWWQEFENVEAEWPIFYLYMMMDGFFKVIIASG